MQKNLTLATIVVTYNGEKWIEKCFGSLIKVPIKRHKIIAIDNGSKDNTVALIKNNYPSVEIIETGSNLGFGAANNIGIRKALEKNFDFVFLLNQDAWLQNPNDLAELIKVASENKEVGIFSPMQCYKKGILDKTFSTYLEKYAPLFLRKFEKKEDFSDIFQVDFVNAASWLISKECLIKCGGFAPVFYHYGEDSNFANRVKYHGYKSCVYSEVGIIHDRPQLIMADLEKDKYKKRINTLAINRLANINHSLLAQIFYLISEMFYKAIKNGTAHRNDKIFIPILSLFYALKEIKTIINIRNQSKQEGAFL